MNTPDKVEGIVLLTSQSRESLNNRQEVAYKNHRKELIQWLSNIGKSPDELEGYAQDTAKSYTSVLDKLHRWAWMHGGGYTLDLTHDEAETYLRNMGRFSI